MKIKPATILPALIAAAVIGLICLLEVLPRIAPRFELFQRLEWISYDWRVRKAASGTPVATNLAAVYLDNESLDIINDAYQFTWPWPRFLHGQVVEELRAQGAVAAGFDILFREVHPHLNEVTVEVPGVGALSSDDFFAYQLGAAGNVVVAGMGETREGQWQALMPAELFRTNALTVGHITSEADSDGVLRRAVAFQDDSEHGRIWHMGIALAARELGLDLDRAVVKPGRILLPGPNGAGRIIPIDGGNFFYINWALEWNDPRLTQASYVVLLNLHELRRHGTRDDYLEYLEELRREGVATLAGDDPYRDKIVVIGSVGSGNNIADMGTTPLAKDTFLLSKHWNVANSVMTGRFVQRSSPAVNLSLIVLMGAIAAVLTWKLRAVRASLCVAAVLLAYGGLAMFVYGKFLYWIPMVLPLGGALLCTHVSLITYRVVFEQNERRRVKAVFSRIVSPDVVNELLEAEKLNLGGARREITVFFADVRGFTQMTDDFHQRAEQYVREQNLGKAEAEAYFDEQARQTLETVNLYLGSIADTIKKHTGTLDKYMGDCVMAFWGAPAPDERHALHCVRAAIDSQRAMYALNQERFAENKRREAENIERKKNGRPLLPMLPLLSLGTGINTGEVIVGLMGSDDHILNYTVFGREVNLASRLEGVSGRGRIIISESTFRSIQRDDPQLAATCVAQPPVTVKGIREAVKIYEVPWKVPAAEAARPAAVADTAPPSEAVRAS